MDLEFVLEPGKEDLIIRVRGQEIIYEPKKEQIRFLDVAAPVALEDGRLKLRILVDRGSVEVFADKAPFNSSQDYGLAMSIAGLLHATKGQMCFGTDRRGVDVGDTVVQLVERTKGEVHVARVE